MAGSWCTEEKLGGLYRSRIAKIPFVRGVIMLSDALGLGMRALTISANTQTGEDEKLEGPALYLTLGIAMVFGIGLFFLLPAGVGGLTKNISRLERMVEQHRGGRGSSGAARRVHLGDRLHAGHQAGVRLSWR